MIDQPLMAAISAEALAKIGLFHSQNLGNTVWAYAKLAVQDYKLLHAIASAAMSKLQHFRPQELSNTAWAVAKLGFRHGPLMDAIAAESIKNISALIPHDLSGTAWAFATLSLIAHEPLFAAISAASQPRLRDFNSQDLANMAWSCATLCFSNSEMLDSQSAEVRAKIADFAAEGLVTTAWAYSSLGRRDSTLMDAISAEVLRKINEIEPQSLGILADANIGCCEAVEAALEPYVQQFFAAMPLSLDAWTSGEFPDFLRDLRVDNFGARCTRRVFEYMGLKEPRGDFCERAKVKIKHEIASLGGCASDCALALSGSALVHRRVFSFAEYHLDLPGGGVDPIVGTVVKESGNRSGGGGTVGSNVRHAWPLQAATSPISGLINRTLCSEFQLLCAVVDIVQSSFSGVTGSCDFHSRVHGNVRLFISTAPCVSCLGVIRQFQLLFSCTAIEVANGEEAYLFTT